MTTATMTRKECEDMAAAVSRMRHLLGSVVVEKMFGSAVGYTVVAMSRFLGNLVVTDLDAAREFSVRNEAARRAGVPGYEEVGPPPRQPMPTEAEMRAMVVALREFGATR